MKNGKNTEGAKVCCQSAGPDLVPRLHQQHRAGPLRPVYKDMINDDLWSKNDLYTQYKTIVSTGRTMAFSSPPLAAYAEITTKYVIGDMIQDVVLRKMKSADALANFVKTAQEIYNKPENKPK